jgi:hypothetical protein
MLQDVEHLTHMDQAHALDVPITLQELTHALNTGAKNRAPGCDGFGLEFYTTNWDTIKTDLLLLFNQMFVQHRLSVKQKHGIVINLPKCPNPQALSDYRPITLLTTEYKIMSRIIANRLRNTFTDQLRESQHCGLPGTTILDITAGIRDTVAYAETAHIPMCVLLLDFQNAFDRISHTYLFRILHK